MQIGFSVLSLMEYRRIDAFLADEDSFRWTGTCPFWAAVLGDPAGQPRTQSALALLRMLAVQVRKTERLLGASMRDNILLLTEVHLACMAQGFS